MVAGCRPVSAWLWALLRVVLPATVVNVPVGEVAYTSRVSPVFEVLNDTVKLVVVMLLGTGFVVRLGVRPWIKSSYLRLSSW